MTQHIPIDISSITDPYELLGIASTSSPKEITLAYRKKALQCHPDRVSSGTEEERQKATQQFQTLGFIYSVLSDPVKRKRFDQTKDLSEASSSTGCFFEEGKDWDLYFKEMFGELVTIGKIAEFEAQYKGSEEEKGHILEAYTLFKGNVDKMMENVMLANWEDLGTWETLVQQAIRDGHVKEYRSWNTSLKRAEKDKIKRKRKAEMEAKEAEELAEELGIQHKLSKVKQNEEDSLLELQKVMQANREQKMNQMIENLEKKYGKATKKDKKGSKPNSSRKTTTKSNT